jgi:hypothetical protein
MNNSLLSFSQSASSSRPAVKTKVRSDLLSLAGIIRLILAAIMLSPR